MHASKYILVVEDERILALESAISSPETIELWLGELGHALADIRDAGARMKRVVADMRIFSRPPVAQHAVFDPTSSVQRALRMTAHEFQNRARVRTTFDPIPLVIADETKLSQVLINLLINAAQAMSPLDAATNELHVATRTHGNGRAVVEIRDTGSGIPNDTLQRVFEPFFTTKPSGIGTGLGLSISHDIVQSFGGEIRISSEVGNGTTVRVLLPALNPDAFDQGAS